MNEMGPLENQKSQSGQAIVEYVLLLAISVALILGFANQFYRPFGNWVQNQMGPYLECLLDVGELPGMGGQEAGECANQFQPFPGSNGNPNQIAQNEKDKDEKAGNKNKAGSSADETGGNGSTQGAYGSSGGRYGRNVGFKIGGQNGSDSPSSGAGSETMTEKLPQSKFFKLRSNNGQQRTLLTGSGGSGITGELQNIKTDKKENKEKAFNIGKLDESEGPSSKAKKLIVKPTDRKVAEEEVQTSWSFGQYLKYLVIILIIIALVLFLAGQAAQISKSMEK